MSLLANLILLARFPLDAEGLELRLEGMHKRPEKVKGVRVNH